MDEEEPVAATDLEMIESESGRVERWRAGVLEKVGYDPIAALELATRRDVDLHYALKLIETGCPPEVAAKILL